MNGIDEMVNAAAATLSAEGKIEAMVKVALEKAIGTVVQEAVCGYNSPFTVELKKYVAGALPMDFKRIGLDGYGDMVIKVIKQKLDASLEAWVSKGIAEEMKELLAHPPESMKVSELLKELQKEQDSDAREDGFSAHLTKDSYISGYWELALDAKPGLDRNKCGFRLSFDKEGQMYSIRVPYGGDITKVLFVGPVHGFERVLLRLYMAKTKLVLDEEGKQMIEWCA